MKTFMSFVFLLFFYSVAQAAPSEYMVQLDLNMAGKPFCKGQYRIGMRETLLACKKMHGADEARIKLHIQEPEKSADNRKALSVAVTIEKTDAKGKIVSSESRVRTLVSQSAGLGQTHGGQRDFDYQVSITEIR